MLPNSNQRAEQNGPEDDDNQARGVPLLPPDETTATSAAVVSSDAKNDDSTTILNDATTNILVDTVTKQEADELLVAEDAAHFQPPKQPWLKRLLRQKKVWIPLAIVVILVVLAAVPLTRYKILGLVWKQEVSFVVLDAQTHQPVSIPAIAISGERGAVDVFAKNDGKITADIPVGKATVTVTKRYYKTTRQTILVSLRKPGVQTIVLQATGRQVPVRVVNKITGQPVNGVVVAAVGTSSQTDKSGRATIVLPADKSSVSGTITAPSQGYNQAPIVIKIATQPGNADTFQLTPAGKIYFLSNASGTIDVVSTNLDGSNRQTVLAGTGNESTTNTQLFHSADWKYLALLATRDTSSTDYGTLYLVNPASGQLTTIQSGTNEYISVIGWSPQDRLVYTVSSATASNWQPGGELLKSYNPASGQATTLDQTAADGTSNSDYASQTIANVFILNNDLVLYTKDWNASYPTTSVSTSGKQMEIDVIGTGGADQQTLKTFPTTFNNYLSAIENQPDDYYISDNEASTTTYYEYVNGSLSAAPASVNAQTFNNYFSNTESNYYLSTAGTATTWSAERDGHTVIFTGNATGGNPQQIATLDSSFGIIGWYGSQYLLLEKSNNTLFIMPASGLTGSAQPLKLTDYFSSQAANYN